MKLSYLILIQINKAHIFEIHFSADKNKNRNDAITEIYKILRPGEPPTVEAADKLFRSLFFDRERYDLSPVGRLKINSRLNLDTDLDVKFLRTTI